MADKKISQLTASTTPLAGTEVLPIVQSGQTTQVSVANLTAGRSVSATSFVPSGSAIPTNGVYLPAANQLGLATNNTLRFLIDGSGYPTVKSASSAQFIIENTNNASYVVFKSGASSTGMIASNVGSVSNLLFYTNAGTLTEKMRIFASGGVSIGDGTDPSAGNLRLGTGNLVIGTAGKGIDFSADPSAGGMTSELLDDYEEGTWTPLYNTINSNLANFTAFQTAGKYTKVGNIVTVHCNIATTLAASISGTGSVIITGLPFAPSVTGSGGVSFTALTSDNRFTNNPSFGQVANAQTTVNLYKTSAMNVANALVVADMRNVDAANYNLLSFCVTYPVA